MSSRSALRHAHQHSSLGLGQPRYSCRTGDVELRHEDCFGSGRLPLEILCRRAVCRFRDATRAQSIPTFIPTFLRNRGYEQLVAGNRVRDFPWSEATAGNIGHQRICPIQTFDIFEGTEQIQQLVISRAISGMRIE